MSQIWVHVAIFATGKITYLPFCTSAVVWQFIDLKTQITHFIPPPLSAQKKYSSGKQKLAFFYKEGINFLKEKQ